MAYATVTLTGTYQTPDGTPHKGHVEIIPSERVIKDTTGNVILTGRVKVDLDAQGAFSVVLPATDDDTLNPTGFGYTIAAKLHSSHPPAVSFSLPAALGATTVEDLTPVDPSTFAPTTTYAESSEVAALDTRVTTELATKANSADLATVATTGNYGDLTAKPARSAQLHLPLNLNPAIMVADNAAAPLTIPTPYTGIGPDVVHPSVVFIPEGFGPQGFTYWMGYTPYPNSDSGYENPCIAASMDGQTWEVPNGLTNPLQPDPGGNDYHSDPHLVFDGDTLHLFYRLNRDPNRIIYHQSSEDGVEWTAQVATLTTDINTSNPASPAVTFDGDTWTMFYVENVGATHTIQRVTATNPDGPWSAPEATDITAAAGKWLWHLDVQYASGSYFALINETNDGNQSEGQLYLTTSPDGLTWDVGAGPLLNVGSTWDTSIYRASSLPIIRDGKITLAIWYSAIGTGWGIGYTEARLKDLNNDTAFYPASVFQPDIGSPVLGKGGNGRLPAMLFDAAASEQIHGVVRVPLSWSTFHVYYLWSSEAQTTGAVKWGYKESAVTPGTTLATGDYDGPAATPTTGGAYVLNKTRLTAATGRTVPSSGLINLRPIRRGADAADTVAGDVALVGVLLERRT